MNSSEMDKIISILEHDLKSPLIGIISITSLVKFIPSSKISKKELCEFLLKIDNKAHQAINLIEDMGYFSRLQNYKTIKRESINITEIFLSFGKKYRKDLIIKPKKDVSIRGNKEIIVKILNIMVNNIISSFYRNGPVFISYQKNKNLKLCFSYKFKSGVTGASASISSGKEKFYYYFLLELLRFQGGTYKIQCKNGEIRIWITL